MLAPLRDPVYSASARTLCGSLAEMERVIGDALFAGYVGYNGRAPGGIPKKEDSADSSNRNKSGGDARHTLVAYFEIIELASILCVDRETANLAVRIFRHTANNTSLRNRNVESLATAAFVAATELRRAQYQDFIARFPQYASMDISDPNAQPSPDDPLARKFPVVPRDIKIEEVSTAANLDTSEVRRYLKVVNVALRKHRPENSSSITAHMPTFFKRLELPERTQRLAIAIAEKALQNNICSRRNPLSVSAAAIYFACQLDGVRKTQTEIRQATTLTEVTLRKVYKELHQEHTSLLPDWYKADADRIPDTNVETSTSQREGNLSAKMEDVVKTEESLAAQGLESQDQQDGLSSEPPVGDALVPPPPPLPPPLPPGFGNGAPSQAVAVETTKTQPTDRAASSGELQPKPPLPSGSASDSKAPAVPQSNPLMAMMANPMMQAFANAMANFPQMMMPPPPPPLPPSSVGQVNKSTETNNTNPEGSANDSGQMNQQSACANIVNGQGAGSGAIPMPPNFAVGNDAPQLLAGMQSMMGMMQAMQAFQTTQHTVPGGVPSVQPPMPSVPSIPSMPSMPSMPSIPSMPSMPPATNVAAEEKREPQNHVKQPNANPP